MDPTNQSVPYQNGAYPYPYPQQQTQNISQEAGSKTLYVGNLDPKVTEFMLTDIFSTSGPVTHVKIISDKNVNGTGPNYGFVEMQDSQRAESALTILNGRKIFGLEIKVNWAFSAGGPNQKEDTSDHYHIFVGDLCAEVDDEILSKAFSIFGSMSDARVMWDVTSKKSRGFGFVAFRQKQDAERAIATMSGEYLGTRAIRVNWANQKGSQVKNVLGESSANSYDTIVNQSSPSNTTVYLGNLPNYISQSHLAPYFAPYGMIVEMRVQADRNFAFVKMATHEQAASAISCLQGTTINGRTIRCSWGKDKFNDNNSNVYNRAPPANHYQFVDYNQDYNQEYGHMAGYAPMQGGMMNPEMDAMSQINPNFGYGYDYNPYYAYPPQQDPNMQGYGDSNSGYAGEPQQQQHYNV